MQRLFLRNEIHGTVHLYIGQEAVSVGVCSALRRGRSRGGHLPRARRSARQWAPIREALAAELMGRTTGVCGGRAGSMNVVDLEHGLIGCFGIVGGSIAAATGAGITAARDGRVVVAFFGDGAANQGYFHECLNFAQVMRLPVLYVCENNLYGEFTPTELVTAGGDIGARAAGAAAFRPSGSTATTWRRWRRRPARPWSGPARGEGPRSSRRVTYRQVGHSKSDPGAYRPEGELEWWLARDPLSLAAGAADRRARLGEERVAEVERAVAERIEDAVEAALAGPYPDPDGRARRASTRREPRSPHGRPRGARRGAGRDERVVFFGEDVAAAGGVFEVTPGLQERFGARRVFDTPISELALAGAAFGSAVDRHAPGGRDHVRRLHAAGDGRAREPGGEVLVHLERAGAACRSWSAARWAAAAGSARSTRRSRRPGSRASPG